MSMVATEIGTVPISGFKWYFILLEGPFKDEIRNEIDKHFLTLGKELGEDAIVIRGYEPTRFSKSVETAAFYEKKWKENITAPALIILNESPNALTNTDKLKKAKIMVFSLREIFEEAKTIAPFLEKLLNAINEEDAIKALEKLEKGKLRKFWGWVLKYGIAKPQFAGFGFDVSKALKELG